jgi:hypothetical protein
MAEATDVREVVGALRDAIHVAAAGVQHHREMIDTFVSDCVDELRKVGCALDDLGDLDDAEVDRFRAEAEELLTEAEDQLDELRDQAEDATESADTALGGVEKLLNESALE